MTVLQRKIILDFSDSDLPVHPINRRRADFNVIWNAIALLLRSGFYGVTYAMPVSAIPSTKSRSTVRVRIGLVSIRRHIPFCRASRRSL